MWFCIIISVLKGLYSTFLTALPEADAVELNAIGNTFAKNTTVKVGSVKSNMGHSEAASGVVALTKVIITLSTLVYAKLVIT